MSSKVKAKYAVTYGDKVNRGTTWNRSNYFSWISEYRYGSRSSVNINRLNSSSHPSGPSDVVEMSKIPEFKRQVRAKSSKQSATTSHTQLIQLEAPRIQLFCSLVTLVSIYLYDSCIIANVPDSQNTAIDSILLLIFIVFITETVVRLTIEPTYRKSLHMLIDIMSLSSIILDLSWVHDNNTNLGAVRGVRLASRLGRVLRLLPLFQTIKFRITPVQIQDETNTDVVTTPQTSQHSSKSSKSITETMTTSSIRGEKSLANRTTDSLHSTHPTDKYFTSRDSVIPSSFAICASTSTSSSVDRALLNAAKHVHTRVAAIIALLAVVAPYFIYSAPDTSASAWIENLQLMTTQYSTTSSQVEAMAAKMKNFYNDKPYQLLSVYANGPYLDTPLYAVYVTTHNVIRSSNRLVYSSTYIVNELAYNTVIELDQTYIAQEQSARYLGLASLAIFILVLFAWSLTHLLENYAVVPLNRLVASLKCSAKDIVRNVQAMSKKLLADGADIYGSDAGSSDENDEAGHCIEYENNTRLEGQRSAQSGMGPIVINPGEVDDDEQWINEDREAVQDLAHTVNKLTRMVTRLFQPVVEIEAGQIDTATEAWLNVNYLRPGQRSSLSPCDDRGPLHYHNSAKARVHMQALAERQTAVSLDLLNSWSFDVLNYSNDQLSEVLTYLFSVHNFFVDFNVPAGSFLAFVNEISSRYVATNTYHNFKHGCDVCHTTHRYLSISRLSSSCMSRLELFSILVAALSHDVGHPGVNNIYLVNSKNELALRHNDKSPLENMHCSVLYEILAKPATNIFAGLNEIQWRESRKIILTAILGTDMVNHYDQITKAQLFLEVNGRETASFSRGERLDRPECLDEDSNRMFMLELLLHCADISNPCKPFKICEKWSALVAEEFARQGDREKREGLEVSPMMNRDQIVLCNMQLGFIEFVVSPLITTVVKIFPPLSEVGEFMTQNFSLWAGRRKQEIIDMPPNVNGFSHQERLEECRKLDERVAKYIEKMNFLSQLRRAPTRRKNRRSFSTSGADFGSSSVCNGSPRITMLKPLPRSTSVRTGSHPQL